MTRRTHRNTVQAAVEDFRDAANLFTWPADEVTPLPDPDRQARAQAIADRLWTARASRDWRQFDRVLIAQLSLTTAELDGIQTLISKTGYVVGQPGKSGKTQYTRSPLLDPLQALQNRQITLSRALGVTGAQGADTRTVSASAQRVNDMRQSFATGGSAAPQGRLYKDRPQ